MLGMVSSPVPLVEHVAEAVVPNLFHSELYQVKNVNLLVSHKCDSPPVTLEYIA